MEKFIARGPVTVQGRDYRGGDTFEAELADVAGQDAEQLGGADKTVPTDKNERLAAITAAIGQLDPNDPDLFLKDGKPKIEAIAAITGWLVSAKERDAAWEQIR